jgi:hypothetical protein
MCPLRCCPGFRRREAFDLHEWIEQRDLKPDLLAA